MGGLRDKLKNKTYGRTPHQLLPGEKAIFDRLPPDADEETLETTARLLEIFVRIFWSKEELSQDDEDFRFVEELWARKSTDEKHKKIFQAYEVEGFGNLIEKVVLNLITLKGRVKELTSEYEVLNDVLERNRQIYQDSLLELRRREKILSLLTRNNNGGFEKKEAIIRGLEKINRQKETLTKNFEKEKSISSKLKSINLSALNKTWLPKSRFDDVRQIQIVEVFRYEFLSTVPYRFVELFWEADKNLIEDFFETLKTDDFFSELRTENLPDEYFEKGWKRKLEPRDKTKFTEIERIFLKILTVNRWEWSTKLSLFKDANWKAINGGKNDFSMQLSSESFPPINNDKFAFADDENFIFLEAGRVKISFATGHFYPKIVNGQFLDSKNWPNKVLELREIFFFLEEIFPRGKNNNQNPLLQKNGFINCLLKKYSEKNHCDFTIWRQKITTSLKFYSETPIIFLNNFTKTIGVFNHPPLKQGSRFQNEKVQIEKEEGEKNNFLKLYREYFFDKKIIKWGEYEYESLLHRKTRAGTPLEAKINHKLSHYDGYHESYRTVVRKVIKEYSIFKSLVSAEFGEEYFERSTELKYSFLNCLTKSASKIFSNIEKIEEVRQWERQTYEEIRIKEQRRGDQKVSTEKTWFRWSYVREAISQTSFINIWEPIEELIDSQKDEVSLRKEEKNKAKSLKRRKKAELEEVEGMMKKEEERIFFKLSTFFSQQSLQVDDTEKIESFSEFICRFDTLGHQIFWTIFFLAITNVSAVLYFCWDKIIAWWNKSPFDWILEEEEKSEINSKNE